ncbi:MAG TPA: class I SAM-dependent methyltransferase [Kofleriaceae bacterium]|nr:class I SAM-dependent methyltransferase [Kofleriaceae bacterium]
MSDEKRKRARELAKRAIGDGRPLAWFDELYREAARGDAIVPWDDARPNPLLVRWLDAHPMRGRALDVGCGTGDNAIELARRGMDVTAFDVSPAAIEVARVRYPDPRITWEIASATDPPAAWRRSFDLVVEIFTLQVLPPALRSEAARALASLVAPGGTLLVIARAREPDDPEGAMPWPLTRAELEAIPLPLVAIEDTFDDETPPVRRWVATYRA